MSMTTCPIKIVNAKTQETGKITFVISLMLSQITLCI